MAFERAREAFKYSYATAERELVGALGRVQETTGLKVKDASAWGRVTAEEAKTRADGVLAAVKERAVAAEGEAKTKATEIVEAVKEKVDAAEKEAEKAVDAAQNKVQEKKRLV
jgi:MICOS complex subunit MIC26